MSNRRLRFVLLSCWAALLGLGLLLFSLPLGGWLRWGMVALLLAVLLLALWWRLGRGELDGERLAWLPVGVDPATPVILWRLAASADTAPVAVLHDGQALWLYAADGDQLQALAEDITHWRGRPPEAALLLVAPALCQQLGALHGEVAAWRYGLQLLRQRYGKRISHWLGLYVPGQQLEAVSPAWRGVLYHPDQPAQPAAALLERAMAAQDLVGRAAVADVAGDMRTQLVLRWAQTQLLPALCDLSRGLPAMRLHGVLCGELPGQVTSSVLGQWSQQQATLQLKNIAHAGRWPLPAALVPLLVQSQRAVAGWRSLLHAVLLAALALVIALACSYLGNRQLLQRVAADLANWQQLPAQAGAAERLAVLAQLRADRALLSGYVRDGVPLRLGWGLYRGQHLLQPLERAIASWHPPAPPAAPVVIALDSLSLFDSGSARLKPDAGRALVGALLAISAHPDKRVLIAGHSDNTGNRAANQRLSEARAGAVRDWFVAMSKLPNSHFGIQGYGDSRPLVPNDSPHNKARNRRVEITLLPDEPAH